MNKEIYLAGGCFWGVEEYMSRLPGVQDVQSGYANSRVANPSYQQVCTGRTGAAETVRVVYDPEKISLANILRHFFGIINPLSLNRQGNDQGTQYRTGVYYVNPEDKGEIAGAFAEEQGRHGLPLVVELAPLENFWPAEEYHQDYLKKNPGGYCHINLDKSRKLELPRQYPGPGSRNLREELTPMQYAVTQEGQTEPPFTGQHWNRHDKGIYVDVVTGEPLFSSADKFDSGTGWASFTAAVEPGVITGRMDTSHGMRRIEARSRFGDSHLGHIFPDGPAGLRYCINDAALRFVPAEEMQSQGYGYLLDKVEKK